MTIQALFDAVPLWLFFPLTIVLVAGVMEIGFPYGKHIRNRPSREAEPEVTLVVMSVLGLVAFMLGFTLGLAESRYESRRETKFSEADAISTAYRRALALSVSTVICVIVDLDRPHKGTLRLSREAMTELHRAFAPKSQHRSRPVAESDDA